LFCLLADVAGEMDKAVAETEKLMEGKWEHMAYLEKKTEKPREQLPTPEELDQFIADERRKIAGGR
jgi:tryptophanyl-tRNA synthetase